MIKRKPPNVRVGQPAGFEKQLYQLQGDEVPEKWILWKQDFNEKIVTKTPKWDSVYEALIDLTNKSASAAIYDGFNELNISENTSVVLKYPDYAPFRNKATQKKLLAQATKNDGSTMNDIEGQAAWDAFVRKPDDINPLFFEEMLFRLEELIFGTDMIGCNAYQFLRKLI